MDTFLEEILSSQTLLFATLSYAIGTVPFGLILTKFFSGKNLREVGSRNIGATNAARVAGPFIGVLTLILDAAKGYLPGSIALSLGASVEVAVLCGLCAFFGHCFPVWLRFSGGKGVATALGVLLSLSVSLATFALLGFACGYLFFKRVGAASLSGSVTACLASFWLLDANFVKAVIVLMLVVIFIRHQENIRQMFFREES